MPETKVRPPWWYRWMFERTDLAYGYLLNRNPKEWGWWFAFGNGYETWLSVVGRRRGYIDQPDPAAGVPAWIEALFQMVMVKRTAAVQRYYARHHAEYVSVEVAAEMLALSTATVRRWCERGDLEATKTGRRTWMIRSESVRRNI